MSNKTASLLHGFAGLFYILAAQGVFFLTIIAFTAGKFLYFAIGFGSGLVTTWLGLVLDGLHVIAINTERSARAAESNKDTADKNVFPTVSDELPEL